MFLKSSSSSVGGVEYLIVGLGNPGREYENTRHNAGFLAIDRLADRLQIKVNRLKFQSLCGDGQLDGHRVLLIKPSTFMNRSGEAVAQAMRFYKIPIERVIILYDDISLPVGQLRCRRKGSDGGHNGIKSILYATESDAFPRIKLGVGQKPHPDYDLAAWVLGKFAKEDTPAIEQMLNGAADAAALIVSGQMDRAMNLYNTAPKAKPPQSEQPKPPKRGTPDERI